MLPSDYAFFAIIALIIVALIDEDSGGGKRGRMRASIPC
jgi:hypothetical protein